MFLGLIYELGLLLLAFIALPFLLYRRFINGKYQQSLRKRFGISFPYVKSDGRDVIWIHAVSLGETKAITPLVKMIKSRFDHPVIVFSNTTETGHVEACRSIPADYHVFLPFDFGFVIKPIINRVSPKLLIMCESDFWFNLIRSTKINGGKVTVVNGKISVKSAKRFTRFSWLSKKMFEYIDLIAVQSHLYESRFVGMGVPQEKLIVTGNMKFDFDHPKLPPEQLKAWRAELGINPKDSILVVGSTHSPEEEQILGILSRIWKEIPNLKVILVPRHPERFNEVAGILQRMNIPFRRLSQKGNVEHPVSVVLVDAMGLLCKCYQLADVAIVAGSFTDRIGGHNILEPAWYGVPTLFGLHMHTQPDLVELAKEYGSGRQVDIDELETQLLDLFHNPEKRRGMAEGGLRLASDVHGATEKTYRLLHDLMKK